ncbi:unnamed protein product, partial [Brassica oleracea]
IVKIIFRSAVKIVIQSLVVKIFFKSTVVKIAVVLRSRSTIIFLLRIITRDDKASLKSPNPFTQRSKKP